MTRLFLLILIIPSLLLGQTKDELDLCMAIQGNNFSTNTAAENALNKILNTIGASKNFVLSPCEKINNAVATAYKGIRYILYDKEFMNLINRNTNDWSNLFVLAHEVGHHINGHSIDLLLYTSEIVEPKSLAKKREQELEADEFAAFVLAKLGANLSQLNNVITLISDNSDDTYSTHPKRSKRLASVKNGFNKGYIKKETKKIYVDYKSKKYDKSVDYKKVGDWYVYEKNDPFSKEKHFIIPGKIYGENLHIKEAPNLRVDVITEFSVISFDDFIVEPIKEYFSYEDKGFSKGGKMYLQLIILDSSGNEIAPSRGGERYPFSLLIKSPLNSDEKINLPIHRYPNEALIKGTKLLIKIEKIIYGSWLRFRGSLRLKQYEPNYTVNIFDNIYFEYSLIGSSKALAD